MGGKKRAGPRNEEPLNLWLLLPLTLTGVLWLVGAGLSLEVADAVATMARPELVALKGTERSSVSDVLALGLWLVGSIPLVLLAKLITWTIGPVRNAMKRAGYRDYRGTTFATANAGWIGFMPTWVTLGLVITALGFGLLYSD